MLQYALDLEIYSITAYHNSEPEAILYCSDDTVAYRHVSPRDQPQTAKTSGESRTVSRLACMSISFYILGYNRTNRTLIHP